jgi:hypothetical protein
MANPNVAALSAGLSEKGPAIFKNLVTEMDLVNDGVLVLTNVDKPTPLAKLSSTGAPRPYRTQEDSSGNTSKFSNRTLTAHQSKWDFEAFDPEQFRGTFLASKKDTMYELVAEKLAEDYLGMIDDQVLYLGVRDANGTDAVDIATGWGSIIAAEILAANLTNVVVTGAITTSNAVTKVEAVIAAAPSRMKKKRSKTQIKAVVYVSYDVFDKYKAHYRTTNPFGFNRKDGDKDYFLDGYPNIAIRPVSWMGVSQRIIFTWETNLVFGTDGTNIGMHPTMKYNTIELRLTFPVGCEIQDLEALWVNDQA